MSVDIEAEFADLDKFYPGSKRPRRDAPVAVEEVLWDSKPIIKKLDGEDVEFFLVGALASALGKSTITIRLWERKSYIPKSPFRLPSHERAGKTVPGKRVFTRELINIAVEEFAARGLLGTARIEWSQHHELTIALFERWTSATSA